MHRLEKFHHHPGAHCGSTALADVARFHGQALSEPLCLGIGEGLGFAVAEGAADAPSRLVMGRNSDMEARFFENLGVAFEWEKDADDARAWQHAKDRVDAGTPALLRTDLRYLPYYKSKTHFTGHVVVLAGYDEGRGVAYLADTQFPGLQEAPLPALEKARTSRHGMAPLRNHAFPVAPFTLPRDRGGLYRRAIASQARKMRDGRDLGLAKTGTLGMRHLADTFPAWAEVSDWQWCARFAYQFIEKRGTGGGNFRRLYAEFLAQAAPHAPGLDLLGRAVQMMEIAEGWSALARALKAVSEARAPDGFQEAGRMMSEIADREDAFFTWAAAIAP
ncbi:MAG: BtrH N-terminal domain-containing protein [Myxococcota bacterium]